MSRHSPAATQPLPKRFVLYVPAALSPSQRLIEALEGILCDRLGGVTRYPARGTFRFPSGRRISERIEVLESYCELEEWPAREPFLIALAAVAGSLLEQDSIACSVDGRMQLVAPDSPGGKRLPSQPEELESRLVELAEALSGGSRG